MTTSTTPLDNPVYHSLQQTHQKFSLPSQNIAFYHPDFCPFGGFIDEAHIENAIDQYAQLTSDFFIVGEKPKYSSAVQLHKELVCNQMLLETEIDPVEGEDVIELGLPHNDDLFNLVNLVQPGYFKSKTSQLGSYYGIYNDEALIAVTGERMKMNSFTEVSAVVTHPDHTGKGYAKQLIIHTVDKIFGENKIPYLHVTETNVGAIKLYEKLGFRTRRKISFWNLMANDPVNSTP